VQVEKSGENHDHGISPSAVSVLRRSHGRGFNSLRRESIKRRRHANGMVLVSLIGVAGLVMLFGLLLR
jgi:hypothetical protein